MSRVATRQYNSVKGAMFETIVKILISKSGYLPLPADRNYVRGDELRGRGAWHQIDAFGLFAYGIPFLYPIRLMCEAKHYGDDKVGLPDVRNFFGAFKDIQEVYYIERYGQSMELFTKRYTDAAALFFFKRIYYSCSRLCLCTRHQTNFVRIQSVNVEYYT